MKRTIVACDRCCKEIEGSVFGLSVDLHNQSPNFIKQCMRTHEIKGLLWYHELCQNCYTDVLGNIERFFTRLKESK